MEITVELPNDLAQHEDPGREALEALAIAGFRSGKLTYHEASRVLGFTYRFQLEGLLKERNILDHAYDVDDLELDLKSLKKTSERNTR